MSAEFDRSNEDQLVREVTDSVASWVTGVDRATIEARVLASYRSLEYRSWPSGYLAALMENHVLSQFQAGAPTAEPAPPALAPPRERSLAWRVGLWTYGLFTLGFALAPLVYSVVAGTGWRSILCITLPFALLLLPGTIKNLREYWSQP
jgi:MFS family permease